MNTPLNFFLGNQQRLQIGAANICKDLRRAIKIANCKSPRETQVRLALALAQVSPNELSYELTKLDKNKNKNKNKKKKN